MKIVPYDPKYRKDFIELNRAWISELFELEHIEATVEQGGNIFFALDEDGTVMACCMAGPRADGDWEIMKFAARGMYTGTGAGNACLQACIRYARERGVRRLIIVSNRKCVRALHLYRKNGFVEMPVDREKFPFQRADIAFEQCWE